MAAPRLTSYGLTHVGLVRERNEDAFLARPEAGLWAVADGMGGHQDGDYASAAVINRLAVFKPFPDLEEFTDEVRRALAHVDVHLRARAKAAGPQTVIATTIACLLVFQAEFAAVWAGDSRVYQLRDGELSPLTSDHSRARELVDAGLLTLEQVRLHPEANLITQAIGAGRLHFGTRVGLVRPGDRFLLCTDGLTNHVADNEIAQELGTGTPQEAAERLRDLVLARGASDNLTILIVASDPQWS